nr:glutathione transferase 3-3 - rat (fragments) [Rattus norvegicus]
GLTHPSQIMRFEKYLS